MNNQPVSRHIAGAGACACACACLFVQVCKFLSFLPINTDLLDTHHTHYTKHMTNHAPNTHTHTHTHYIFADYAFGVFATSKMRVGSVFLLITAFGDYV
jgi:hypothetical protein